MTNNKKIINIKKVSEFERELFKTKFCTEIGYLKEIIKTLDEADEYFQEPHLKLATDIVVGDPKHKLKKAISVSQLNIAHRIKGRLETQLKQIEFSKYLNKIELDIEDADTLVQNLKNKRIALMDSQAVKAGILDIEEKIIEEFDRHFNEEESPYQVKINIPITDQETEVLLEAFGT